MLLWSNESGLLDLLWSHERDIKSEEDSQIDLQVARTARRGETFQQAWPKMFKDSSIVFTAHGGRR